MLVCNQPFVTQHYRKIEVVALAFITAIFLGAGVHLLQLRAPMPAAHAAGAFLATAAALSSLILAISLKKLT